MKIVKNSFILFLVLSFFACEDVIEIDLKDVEQQIVIEAAIQANTGVCEVTMTKTRNFYEDNNFETVNQADVELVLPDGTTVTLAETAPGHYKAENIPSLPGEKYQLKINTTDGQLFTASTIAPFPVPIDSLEVEEHPFPDPDLDVDTTYFVVCVAQDPVNQINFFRLKVKVNGKSDPYLFILRDDDVLIDNEIRLGAFSEEVIPGDIVEMEFISIDKAAFQYFEQVSDINQQNGGSSIVPFNPIGNFGDNALGFFGIYHSDFRTIIIE